MSLPWQCLDWLDWSNFIRAVAKSEAGCRAVLATAIAEVFWIKKKKKKKKKKDGLYCKGLTQTYLTKSSG